VCVGVGLWVCGCVCGEILTTEVSGRGTAEGLICIAKVSPGLLCRGQIIRAELGQ
jgi:hypothetical protein